MSNSADILAIPKLKTDSVELRRGIMFITFTKEEPHFLDNLQNGFLLNEH